MRGCSGWSPPGSSKADRTGDSAHERTRFNRWDSRPANNQEQFTLALPWRLSVVVAMLMLFQSAVGSLVPSLYRDPEAWVRAAWFGNNLVTLVVAFPLLAWALLSSRRGSRRAEMVWWSMLGYSVYNYAYNLFGAALNWFFPVYVLLFTLPLLGLILTLRHLDSAAVADGFTGKTPVRWIGGYMLFTGGGLTLAWLGQWANFMLSGAAPAIGEEGFGLVAALDLSSIVPWFLIGALLLIRRRPWPVQRPFLGVSPSRGLVVRDGVDPSTSGFSDRRSATLDLGV